MCRRLLFVVNDAGYFLSHRLPLAIAAARAGWEVHVATAPSPAQERIREAGLAAHSVPLTRSGLRPDRELRAVLAIWRLLRRLRPDVIHCVALKAVVAGGLAARMARLPASVFAITGLGHVFTDGSWKAAMLRTAFRLLLPRLIGPRARLIVQNREDLVRTAAFDQRIRERTVLIPGSGVDLDLFHPTPEPPGPVTVLLPARMIWPKGIGLFVEAARTLRARGSGARFVLAGASDPGNPTAVPEEQLAAWHDEGAVEWLGARGDMPALMSASHIVCLPTYYGEGVPLSLIEAAAAGRPIVATDSPGCRDIVRDGENGLLVPMRDVDALTGALRRLIEDGDLRRRYGARGRELAAKTFSDAQVIGATLSVYENLLS